MRLGTLNALPAPEAERELRRCCGSSRWARSMAAARPFASLEAMQVVSDVLWSSLDPADWLEAFAAHPRIGAGGAARENQDWSASEQSGVGSDSRAAFAALNRAYEERFGYIFIVNATGKSASEMLTMLERRMRNNPDDEVREAAEEQRQITRLRLAKLLI